jgi:hypothetical protein
MENTLSNIFYLAYPSLCEILSIPFSSSGLAYWKTINQRRFPKELM